MDMNVTRLATYILRVTMTTNQKHITTRRPGTVLGKIKPPSGEKDKPLKKHHASMQLETLINDFVPPI